MASDDFTDFSLGRWPMRAPEVGSFMFVAFWEAELSPFLATCAYVVGRLGSIGPFSVCAALGVAIAF